MVLMSMSSSLSPMNGAHFPPIVAYRCKPDLGPATSQDQTLVLAGLAFSPSSDKFERSSWKNAIPPRGFNRINTVSFSIR